MNTSKIKKGQQGFTLVEVIVVAIIVAALAAVAVPMYTSYVESSRKNAAANAAGSVASFMGACINQGADIGTAPTHDGTDTSSIVCQTASSTDTDPRIQLPKGIKIEISNPSGTGTVKATHVESDAADVQSYNY